MKSSNHAFSLSLTLIASVVLSGCDQQDVPPLAFGKPCTIQFRRDALGCGTNLPIPPLTENINGADTSIAGTLERATADWVVIGQNGHEIWIPKGVILLIAQ